MRYSEREREPYRDHDEDYRTDARGNGGRYAEARHGSEIEQRERSRSRRAERYRDEDEGREEWPRAFSYGSEGPTWLRGQEGPGGYGGTSTFGSVYGSPYNASYNDPWFRERAWRPEESGRYGQGRYGQERGGRYGSYQGDRWSAGQSGPAAREDGYGSRGYGSTQGYGSQGYGSSGYRSERFESHDPGQYGQGAQGRFGSQGGHDAGLGGYGADQGHYGGSLDTGRGGYGGGTPGFLRQRSGRHFGRGPKGYQRSDERLREEISDHLMAHPDIDASQVSIEVKNGEVTIEGTVEDRQTKRDVEDLVECIMGVKETNNRLRIQAQSSKWNESENEGSSWQKSGSGGSGSTSAGTSGSAPSGTTSKKS